MGAFERNIQHVVVLMLENRSFDHMLGFLGTSQGLTGHESNKLDLSKPGNAVTVSNDAAYVGDLDVDPSHAYSDVNIQVYGADPPPNPFPKPTNIGFVFNYGQQPPTKDGKKPVPRNIMKCFAPQKLPVLTTLAQEFAVCQRWFSSVPGQTWPNRFFMHAATSMGNIDNKPRVYSARTIYDNLADADEDFAIYFHDMPQSVMLASLRRQKYRKNMKVFAERFKLDCMTGLLPSYSFIEPRYFDFLGFKANDQHPPHDVALGDILIAEVYEIIRNSGMWETTLLVILWDEHGGIFDHVEPERAVNPDGLVHDNPSFDFTRLGLRVPAVLVSPYIKKGTIDDTVYDHTSVLASVKKLFDLPHFLTRRDAAANTFDHLITDDFRQDTPTKLPRPQALTPPPPAHTTAAMTADVVTASMNQASAQPLSEFQQSLVELSKTLETDEGSRTRVARLAADPQNEHEAAVHVRQATNQFIEGDQ